MNGDAGEYFVAYTLTRALGWPCRLYGVDLGVDAEIEVLDAVGHSTGDIIKVQVKAIDGAPADKPLSIYVDDRHIMYWKQFCLPVIVCCVDLSLQQVYWKQITVTEAFRSEGASKKVTFDRDVDLVHAGIKANLERLVQPIASRQIGPLFDTLRARFSRLPTGPVNFYSFDDLAHMESLLIPVENSLTELTPLLTHFPWRISAYAQAELTDIREAIRVLKVSMGQAHADIANGG